MRQTIHLLFWFFMLGCSSENKKEISLSSNEKLPIDSTFDQEIPKTDEVQISNKLEKGVNYLGLIKDFYFLDNNEVYIELYFIKDEITNEDWEQAENLGDSLIFANDENGRTRIPVKEAIKYLDLRGIDSLKIYNHENELRNKEQSVRLETNLV